MAEHMALFIRNAWYVAAYDTELAERPVARRILGEPVALFRQRDGRYAALRDSCAHRLSPLSTGRITERGLRCPYHGFTYDHTGRCVFAPGEARVPHLAVVRSYPVVEQHGLIWIWMGEAAAAADEPLPACLEPYFGPGWVHARGYHHVDAYYELLADNLFDASHADFVHDGILGDERRGLAGTSIVKGNVDGDTVEMTRWDYDDSPPPFVIPMLSSDANVDWWRVARWQPPGPLLFEAGACPAGAQPAQGRFVINPNFLTPESETSTHYFWTVGRTFEIDNAYWTEQLYTQTRAAFDQDKAVIEAQQRSIGTRDLRELRLAVTRSDLPVNRAREVLQRVWRREQQVRRDDVRTAVESKHG
jgi:phenylpropionate dioxygenase-like ring-hydroxylating dioxygenase large terminal subunit